MTTNITQHKRITFKKISSEKQLERIIKNMTSNDTEKETDLRLKKQANEIFELNSRIDELENYINMLNIRMNNGIYDAHKKDIPRLNEYLTRQQDNASFFDSPYVNNKNRIVSKHIEFKTELPKSKSIEMGEIEDFTYTLQEDIAIVTVNIGRAIKDNALDFKSYLDTVEEKHSKFIIDLSQCNIIDSTFMGVIVSFLKKSPKNKSNLRLVLGEKTNSVIFHATQMDKVFRIFENLEDAIISYKSVSNHD